MYILGISALYHDSAAVLIQDGEIVAAAQEERFTRKKHDLGMPYHAIDYCMKQGRISIDKLEAVVYYDNPFMSMHRFLCNVQNIEDSSKLMEMSFGSLIGEKMWWHKLVMRGGLKFFTAQHHLSHAASAFYPSPFEEAVIITVDGVGEWATTTIGIGRGNHIKIIDKIDYPDSLGLLYSAFTYFCGFKVNSGDYKLMGLAPYGKPVYAELIKKEIIQIFSDGSYKLNMEYFLYQNGREMTSPKFAELFGGERRKPEAEITRREMDMAASVQAVIEEVILLIVRHAKESYGRSINNLVLAGGVALNCVANGVIQREKIFGNIWIQPAAGDAGGALGAALSAYYHISKRERKVCDADSMKGSYLGPEYTDEDVMAVLRKYSAEWHCFTEDAANKEIAQLLNDGKVIGIHRGRMEFGPRALGNRSIIADPRSENMQSKLNLKIKYRESFRPFAPSVLAERRTDYFEIDCESPYMLLCAPIQRKLREKFELQEELKENEGNLLPIVNRKRSVLPAVTHVDYSARIQTVTEKCNPQYYGIIKEFEKLTGCGVIINTSFNVRGEPIVCTPEDAYKCFMRTEMDVLVINHFMLYKEEQKSWNDETWKDEFELD